MYASPNRDQIFYCHLFFFHNGNNQKVICDPITMTKNTSIAQKLQLAMCFIVSRIARHVRIMDKLEERNHFVALSLTDICHLRSIFFDLIVMVRRKKHVPITIPHWHWYIFSAWIPKWERINVNVRKSVNNHYLGIQWYTIWEKNTINETYVVRSLFSRLISHHLARHL